MLCADKCAAPTPKKKKVVMKRDIKRERTGFTRANDFISVNQYLKDRQKETTASQGSNATAKKEAPHQIHTIKKADPPKVKFLPKKEEKPDPVKVAPPAAVKEPAKVTPPIATETTGYEDTETRNVVSGTKGNLEGALTIFFDYNSSVVAANEKDKLLTWVEQLGDNVVYYEISGFTCPVNKEQRAVNLSINRAEAIRILIKEKKKRVVVTTKGMGTGRAYDKNDLSQNRRAEIRAFAAKGKPVLPAEESN